MVSKNPPGSAGLVFYNLQPGPDSAQSRISVLFFILLAQQLMPFTYMSFYVANRRFFAADVAAGIYSPSAFYVANSVACEPHTAPLMPPCQPL